MFLLISAPKILQFVNGREFRAAKIDRLREMWSGLFIGHGRPRRLNHKVLRIIIFIITLCITFHNFA